MSGLVLPTTKATGLNLPGAKSSQAGTSPAADSPATGDQQTKQLEGSSNETTTEAEGAAAAASGSVVIPGVHGIVPTLQ